MSCAVISLYFTSRESQHLLMLACRVFSTRSRASGDRAPLVQSSNRDDGPHQPKLLKMVADAFDTRGQPETPFLAQNSVWVML